MANKPLGLLAWIFKHKRGIYPDIMDQIGSKAYAHNLVGDYVKEHYPEVYTQWLLTR